MIGAIRISITVWKYSPADLARDIFDGLLWFYRFSVRLSQFIYSVVKKFLVAVLITEIIDIVLYFGVLRVLVGFGSTMK